MRPGAAASIEGMVRVLIIGIVIAVAFTLYALVDAAMSAGSRARGVSKPVWVVLIVVLPVVGALLWFTIGKGPEHTRTQPAPDDDPRFTGKTLSDADLDRHMRDLEARLRELDDEVFPGESEGGAPDASRATDASQATDAAPATEPKKAPETPESPGSNARPRPDADAGERPEQDRS